MFNLIKSKKFIFILAGLIIASLISIPIYRNKNKIPNYYSVIISSNDLIQSISVTGRVQAAEEVDLAFESSGKINAVLVKVGDQVFKGKTLVRLNNASLTAQVTQAQASLESQQAKLDELKIGTRPEEIQVYQRKVKNAENSLEDAKLNLEVVQSKTDVDLNNLYDDVPDVLTDAYTKSEYAIIEQIDALFSNDSSSSPQLTFNTTNSQAEINVEKNRVIVGNELSAFDLEVENIAFETNHSVLDQKMDSTNQRLLLIREFLSDLSDALSGAINLSATTLSTYQTDLNSARTNLNTAITNLSTQNQSVNSQKATNQSNLATAQASVNTAENTLNLSKNELTLKQAGSTLEQIAAQQAQVKQAQANLDNLRAQLAKTVITAPIKGIITQQNAKIGEIVAANKIMVGLISQNNFEIEIFIPELDIADLKIGDQAKIVLDAYPEIEWQAEVIQIDPAETVIEGVATYKTILQFKEEDGRIKPGLTADIDIVTNQKDNVFSVPFRAIIEKQDKKYLRIITNKNKKLEYQEIEVITGLRGSEGEIEISSGLNEGDEVITFIEE